MMGIPVNDARHSRQCRAHSRINRDFEGNPDPHSARVWALMAPNTRDSSAGSDSWAEAFKAERLRHGHTREQAAAELQCGIQTIERWERGENLPQRRRSDRLAEYFGGRTKQLKRLLGDRFEASAVVYLHGDPSNAESRTTNLNEAQEHLILKTLELLVQRSLSRYDLELTHNLWLARGLNWHRLELAAEETLHTRHELHE